MQHPIEQLSHLLTNYPEPLWEKPISLKRNDFLVRQGQLAPYIFLVQSGASRAVLFEEEEEITLRFGYKGSMVAALHCLYGNLPAQFNIQAIRKCEVVPLSWTNYQKFLNTDPVHQQLNQQVMQALILEQNEREIDLLTNSPTERFRRLLERSPQVFQEIPKKYIANYLRMTPETLSRLMARQ